jgi:mitotic spindle assembly checkpoint protein MAD1
MSGDGAPTSTPVSLTQALSDLRLGHARLLEEHGATIALLRLSEARVLTFEHRETELQEAIESIQQQLRLAEEQVARREARAALADREVGFLQALLASYDAEQEAGVDAETRIDHAKVQQIGQLHQLLRDYKERNQQLERDIDALDADVSLFSAGQSRQELSKAIDNERAEKLLLQKGLFVRLSLSVSLI